MYKYFEDLALTMYKNSVWCGVAWRGVVWWSGGVVVVCVRAHTCVRTRAHARVRARVCV